MKSKVQDTMARSHDSTIPVCLREGVFARTATRWNNAALLMERGISSKEGVVLVLQDSAFCQAYKRSDFVAGAFIFPCANMCSAFTLPQVKSSQKSVIPAPACGWYEFLCVCVCSPEPLRGAFSLAAYRKTEWGRHRWVSLLKLTGECTRLRTRRFTRDHGHIRETPPPHSWALCRNTITHE